jgi:hypothetical protein
MDPVVTPTIEKPYGCVFFAIAMSTGSKDEYLISFISGK